MIEKHQNIQAESQLFHALAFDKPYPYASFHASPDISASQVLRLSPISINTTHNDALVIGGPDTLDITAKEHALITGLLEKHFEAYNISIKGLSHEAWLLCHDKEIKTTPLDELMNQSIFPLLPEGKDKTFWHRLITECQMLLFQETLLQDRGDKLPINGVWLWGESSNQLSHLKATLITDDDDLFACQAKMPGIQLIRYKGQLDKTTLKSLNHCLIYVSALSSEDKALLKKMKYRKKIIWHGINQHLSIGHQDENNNKKKNKRFNDASSFITTLRTYLLSKRDRFTN